MHVAFEAGRLLADSLFLFQFDNAYGLGALRFARANFSQLGGIGYLNIFFTIGVGHMNFALFDFIRHVTTRLLDRLRSSLLADRIDVSTFVGDIRDVDVDQHEANLLEFGLHRILNVLQKGVPVAIDVFNPHRSDHLTQLTKDNFSGLFANFCSRKF